ncbi:30-kDa cleavage and polyadenylation specificity factor 30 isoform X2 [Cryptomeria japonica]|uniref:30-kDa cleavage and polyadenylation specificity factor 30 isoform X2 n=1 Tax=Cryptomeria japonica TaxID=3369 RepID=UPI0025AC39E3|nr:30-kDa cleavage and polyadenylation specificity factor 30 isoform X2 [Cryptomeria japonica]
MEDPEGGLSFDFEGGLETGPNSSNPPVLGSSLNSSDINLGAPSILTPAANRPAAQSGSRSFRQTVCRHWLRSLCMKGESCGFLHQYDKSRMPVCRFFARYGECREPDCVYKHSNDEIKECNMYKHGFCPNGPDCRYRHQKMPGPPPAVEEVFQKLQQWATVTNGSYPNRYPQHRQNNYHHQAEKTQPSPNASQRPLGSSPSGDEPKNQQQQRTQRLPQHQTNQSQGQPVNPSANGFSNQSNVGSAALPLPQGLSRYFVVKSSNKENLELSVQQGMWATQRNNEAKLNEAFDCCDNVILIFSINRTRHFQGCAKMTSKIGGFVGGGGWKHAHGAAHYGRNFSLKWLKLCELSFHKTRHLRNPYNENLPVKAIACAVESKREEEKAQGVNAIPRNEDPNIVPFEDNDDDQDDDESDEEESSSHSLGASQGRGRGRGMMWPPHGPMARAGRGLVGSNPMGFYPVMIGDGYGFDRFGMGPSEGFAMPEMFNASAGPSQGFPPYSHAGPRFGGSEYGAGSNPGMIFHGRAPQPNGIFPHGGARMMAPGPNGMMGGAGRLHFMGGSGVVGNSNRPSGMPFRPPQSGNSGRGRRDHRRRRNEHNTSTDRLQLGMDQRVTGKSQQTRPTGEASETEPSRHQQHNGFRINSYAVTNDDDSESEDEAPRRSRHGESKKKRRDWDGEEEDQADHWELPFTGVEPEENGY